MYNPKKIIFFCFCIALIFIFSAFLYSCQTIEEPDRNKIKNSDYTVETDAQTQDTTEHESDPEKLPELQVKEESDWTEAFEIYKSQDIILPLKNFADLYPNSPHTPEAKEIISKIQNDSAYSEKYLYDGTTLDLIDEFIKNFPGHKDIEKALELREMFIGDIYSLFVDVKIAIAAIGDSITRSRIIIRNETDSRLIVRVPYGTYLAATSGNVQNMLIREEVDISVDSKETIGIYINTLCMNIFKDIPDSESRFSIALLSEDSPLIDLLKTLEENGSNYEVAQAAVWCMTDNPGKETILDTIAYPDGTAAITEEIYNEALRILELCK